MGGGAPRSVQTPRAVTCPLLANSAAVAAPVAASAAPAAAARLVASDGDRRPVGAPPLPVTGALRRRCGEGGLTGRAPGGDLSVAPRCRPAPAPASGGGPLGAELGVVLGGGRRRLCSMEVPDCYARTSPVSLVGLACCRGAKCKARPRGTPPDGRYSHRAPCLRLRGPAAALPPGPRCGPASVAPGPPCLRGPGVALPPWPGRPASVAGPPCLRLRGRAALPPWPGRPASGAPLPPCSGWRGPAVVLAGTQSAVGRPTLPRRHQRWRREQCVLPPSEADAPPRRW